MEDHEYLILLINAFAKHRDYLPKQIRRELLLAKAKFIDEEEFFDRCNNAIGLLKTLIDNQYYNRVHELQFMLIRAKNRTSVFGDEEEGVSYEERCIKTVNYCEGELNWLGRQHFSINLHHVTANKYTGTLWYNDIVFIENGIDEAKRLNTPTSDISAKTKLDFTENKLRPVILEIAKMKAIEKPSTYLDELLNLVKQFNDFEFEANFYLKVHYLCKENAAEFWNEGHKKDITQWLKKAKIVTEVFDSTWTDVSELKDHLISPNNRTKALITEQIEHIDKLKGWEYSFSTFEDLTAFVDLLTNYFEYKPIKFPTKTITLKKDSKTRFARCLREIHKELGNENQKLRTDFEYFKLLRVLSHFKDSSNEEIYRAITR